MESALVQGHRHYSSGEAILAYCHVVKPAFMRREVRYHVCGHVSREF